MAALFELGASFTDVPPPTRVSTCTQGFISFTCVYRKSDSAILVMKTAEDRP
jgi:hypothetical protein